MLTPPDTGSCPTFGLTSVLMLRPISPELVLFPDFWVSNIPLYFSFTTSYILIGKIWTVWGWLAFRTDLFVCRGRESDTYVDVPTPCWQLQLFTLCLLYFLCTSAYAIGQHTFDNFAWRHGVLSPYFLHPPIFVLRENIGCVVPSSLSYACNPDTNVRNRQTKCLLGWRLCGSTLLPSYVGCVFHSMLFEYPSVLSRFCFVSLKKLDTSCLGCTVWTVYSEQPKELQPFAITWVFTLTKSKPILSPDCLRTCSNNYPAVKPKRSILLVVIIFILKELCVTKKAWLPRKWDCRTDRKTPDKAISMCRYVGDTKTHTDKRKRFICLLVVLRHSWRYFSHKCDDLQICRLLEEQWLSGSNVIFICSFRIVNNYLQVKLVWRQILSYDRKRYIWTLPFAILIKS